MMLTGRTIVLLVTMALASGGAAFGLHALMGAAGDVGTDYGLDTNGNGTFDWLVVEAQVAIPQAGTWDISADLSSPNPPPSGSCGYGAPLPMADLPGGSLSPIPSVYPIAWAYERYFFTDGTHTVRMAFAGTDIARSGIDGPYRVHARLSIGGLPYMTLRPIGDWGGPVVEWNYTTKAYAASQFEQPVRPATFTGGHTDSAVDLDADGLADFLELRADVHVNLAGHYTLSGYLSKGAGTTVVRFIASAYRDFDLATTDTSVVLRFRGDQILQAGVDGPWDFSLALYYAPLAYARGNVTPGPIGTILPPHRLIIRKRCAGRRRPVGPRTSTRPWSSSGTRAGSRCSPPIGTETGRSTPSSSGPRSRCSRRRASICPDCSRPRPGPRESPSPSARCGCKRERSGRNSRSPDRTSARAGSTVRTRRHCRSSPGREASTRRRRTRRWRITRPT